MQKLLSRQDVAQLRVDVALSSQEPSFPAFFSREVSEPVSFIARVG